MQNLVNMLSEQLDGACHNEHVVHVDYQVNALGALLLVSGFW